MKKLFLLIFLVCFTQEISAQTQINFPQFVQIGDTLIKYALVQAGDLNHDGKPDLVAMKVDSTMQILINHSTTFIDSFEVVHNLNLGANPKTLIVDFISGDTILDIMTVLENVGINDEVRQYNGTGYGGFSYAASYEYSASATYSIDEMVLADCDGDGDSDIMILGDATGILQVFWGPDYTTNDIFTGLPLSGKNEIEVATFGSALNGPRVLILFPQNNDYNIVQYNMTNGGMNEEVHYILDSPTGYPSCSSLDLYDSDGDGFKDVNATHGLSDAGYFITWDYGVETQQDTLRVGTNPYALTSGNFDGIIGDEAILINAGQDSMTYIKSDGSAQLFASPIADTPNDNAIDVADFDGDGNDDVITVGKNGGLVLIKNNGLWNTLDVPKGQNHFLNAFPNPVQHTLTITGLSGEHQELQMYNSVGQMVHQEITSGTESCSIEMNSFESGIYYVVIGNKRFKITKN